MGIIHLKMDRPTCLVFLGLLVWITCSQGVEISQPSGSLTVSTGETINLQCDADDGSQIQWSHNGMAVTESASKTVTEITDAGSGARTSFLSIEGAQEADSGRYSCRNPDDYFDSSEVVVTVTAESQDVRIVEPTSDELDADIGRSFTLKCKGGSSMNLVWKHMGMPIEISSRAIITSARNVDNHDTISILTRTRITAEDGGEYVCTDQNDPFNRDQITVIVEDSGIIGDPVDIVDPQGTSLPVVAGESFSLQCEGSEGVQIQWYVNDIAATMDSTRYVINTAETGGKTVSLLTREEASEDDSGEYTCFHTEQDSDSVTVTVKEPRTEGGRGDGSVPTESRTLLMSVGGTMSLQCSFEAPGDHEAVWTKEDNVLKSGSKYAINDNVQPSVLKIHNTDRSDTGVYKCSFQQADTQDVVGVVIFNVTTVACTQLVPPVNGSILVCPSAPVLGDSCTFQCDAGFQVSGRVPTYCEMEEGEDTTSWSQPVPTCRRSCGSFWDDLFCGANSVASSHLLLILGLFSVVCVLRLSTD